MTRRTSEIRTANWAGSIPVILSLAPTSLSSPTMPQPRHIMVPRMSYLHVSLKDVILCMYKFAPAVTLFNTAGGKMKTRSEDRDSSSRSSIDSGGNSSDRSLDTRDEDVDRVDGGSHNKKSQPDFCPVCWFEDEESGVPLRWHLFAGVLFDLKKRQNPPTTGAATATSITLPWKLRIHFTSYPSTQIQTFSDAGVLTTVERNFRHSLKQALFLQQGSSKTANAMTKQSHEKIWDGVVQSNYEVYQQVDADLQQFSGENQVVNGSSSSKSNGSAIAPSVQHVPVRLLINSKPPIQRPCPPFVHEDRAGEAAKKKVTLGSVLADWAPQLFSTNPDNGSVYCESESTTRWIVQGIQPPLTTPVFDLWLGLCHPDHFLYILVNTSST